MITLRAWWERRSERERRLCGATAALVLASVATTTVLTTRDRLHDHRAQIDTRRAELARTRRLVAQLRQAAPATAAEGPLLARLETAATQAVGRERLAAMTPATTADGQTQISVRIADAALAEIVGFLHTVEGEDAGTSVTRLELRARPGTDGRFDLVVEIQAAAAPS
jgi:type II secretory pathway component PulM